MASKIRRIYTYTDQQGKEQTILINGNTAKETDKKFQAFLSGMAAVPQEKASPAFKHFIDEVYRPGFMEGLAETTIADYELYIRLYIVPFMGHMRMSEITVATIQKHSVVKVQRHSPVLDDIHKPQQSQLIWISRYNFPTFTYDILTFSRQI